VENPDEMRPKREKTRHHEQKTRGRPFKPGNPGGPGRSHARDPERQVELDYRKQAQEARKRTVARLATESEGAVATLVELTSAKYPPAVRRAASKDVLTESREQAEVNELSERVAALEERLNVVSNGHAPHRVRAQR
jgi:hypothetical protein